MYKYLCFFMCFVLGGCTTISGYKDAAVLKAGYIQKNKAEAAMAQTRAEYNLKLENNERAIKLANDRVLNVLTDKLQLGGNLLYGADFAFSLHPNPDRTHIIMDNKINETRFLMLPPTVEAMAAQNDEVKKHLDEALTSLDDLRVAHKVTLDEMAKINEAANQAQFNLKRAEQERLDIETAKIRELAAKQADLDKANNAVIASEHERGNDAKARHELLTKLSVGAGLLAALCVAGAIFSPLMKLQLGLTAGVFGIAAVGIWYLSPMVVLSIIGGGGIIAVLWVALNYHQEHATATDTYRAIQRAKENSPEEYERAIKPELEEANLKYVKKDGGLIKVVDSSRAAFIDTRLAQVGDK